VSSGRRRYADPPQEEIVMQMPQPSAAHAKLAAFVGEWVGEEILHPSPWAPEKHSAIGRSSNRMGVDGFFLINDYIEERDGEVVFRGHGVYGYDPKRQRYTMHWFDSMGMPPNEMLGSWEGNTLTFQNRGEMGHSRYVYVLEGDDRYQFRIESSTDGQSWTPLMEGHYRRHT
jgi:Protein of unknown function (DUF1579)